MTIRGLGVAAVFLAGCAVGGVSSQLVVPKASAQQAATLTRWEVVCDFVTDNSATRLGNRYGAEGWELATVRAQSSVMDHDVYCFKRPKM